MSILEVLREARITDEVKNIESYINRTWKNFQTELEINLCDLFPEPENKGLKHIWRYGAADLVVRKNGRVVCIIETGGSHHFEDEKQQKNDARKWKLCEINNVRCVQMINGMQKGLSNRQWRNLLGRFLFGIKYGVAG